jgi:L-aminopeptidase/D-esterase-like protein
MNFSAMSRFPVGLLTVLVTNILILSLIPPVADAGPRARDLGIPFTGTPGPLNAIVDVAGVEVGHATIIAGDGKLIIGEGPVRTGVTAVFPLGKAGRDGVAAGWFALNGAGQLTATTIIDEFGGFFGPVLLTGSLSIGSVHSAVINWSRKTITDDDLAMLVRGTPVIGETWDGHLNDALGLHVREEDVFHALDSAAGGLVAEGNVGGGTAMTAYQFKAGIGTASRVVDYEGGSFTVGVLVQANHGRRDQLTIAGVPVGREISDLMPDRQEDTHEPRTGSIIIIVATDAPLLPTQLQRIAKRASLGLARTGSIASNGSGDIFLAFSTANRIALRPAPLESFSFVPNQDISYLFDATVSATEEAIINSLVAAQTMSGINNNRFHALPHDRLREILKKYNRLAD